MTRSVLAGVLILAVTSCSFEGTREVAVHQPAAGLATWGAQLYVVGGEDASGNPRREVWRTTVGSNGSLGSWVREADLPWPTASASVVTFGNFLYVVGGRSPELHREVWFTLINADGSLGFSNSVWVKNPRPLPSALAGAAAFLIDGRLFLAGGETGDGPVGSVLSARIWLDGQVGAWFTGAPLPAPAVGLWAADEGQGVVLVGSGELGGYRSTPDAYGLPVWTETPAPGSDRGPWVPLAGRRFEVAAVNGVQPPTVRSWSPDVVQAEAPNISPSAGAVPAQTPIKAQGFPGDRIVYTVTTDGSVPPTPVDSMTPPALPKVTKPATYAFRTYRDGAAPSATVVVRYQTQASSLFVVIQKSLTPPLPLTNFSLNETLSDQSLHPVTSVRYQVNVSTKSSIGVSVIDADAGGYTARIKVSLLEADQRTPVRLPSGAEFLGLTPNASATLEPGTYYLVVESRDGNTGGTFGLELTQGAAK